MQTIQVSGTTLFHLAAKYLGDASQWLRIAQLNPQLPSQPYGLIDPTITGVVTITIPDVNPQAGGGIPL